MYSRNIGNFFTEDNQQLMLTKTIGIIGVGGVGGYIAEFICRIGCKKIIIFDGDTFNKTNLNRQLFCTLDSIGKNKATETEKRIKTINPTIEIETYDYYVTNNYECVDILSQCDLIFSCGIPYELNPTDIKQLFYILSFIKHIPIVEGGITAEGIVCAYLISGKNLKLFNYIYDSYIINEKQNKETFNVVSSLSYMVSLAASLEVNLGIKYLCQKPVIIDKIIKYNCLYNYCF